MVAMAVIDFLEVVEVEEEQRAVAAVAQTLSTGGTKPFEQHAAVGQIGQRILEGKFFDLELVFLAERTIGQIAMPDGGSVDLFGGRRDAQPFARAFGVDGSELAVPAGLRAAGSVQRCQELRPVLRRDHLEERPGGVRDVLVVQADDLSKTGADEGNGEFTAALALDLEETARNLADELLVEFLQFQPFSWSR